MNGMIYTHWKHGAKYQLLTLGHLEKTHEPMVVYHPIGKPDEVWIRPASEFFGEVSDGQGTMVQRFKATPERKE